MAKASRAEACIFCGNAPCTCNGPAKPKASKRKLTPKVATTNEPTELLTDKGSDLDFEAPAQRSRFKAEEHERPAKSQDELEVEQAIKLLEPLLSEYSKREYAHILNPPRPTALDKRLVDWRKRNGKG